MSLSYQELISSVLLNLGTVERDESQGGESCPYDCTTLGAFAHCIRIEDYYPSETLLSWEALLFNQPHLDFNPIESFMEENDMPEDMVRKLVIYPPDRPADWSVHTGKVDQSCMDFLAAEYEMAQGFWVFHGVHFRPLEVPPDGSCFTHSLSVATTGSHVFFDALRYCIFRELRDNRSHYTSIGTHGFMSQYADSFRRLQSEAGVRGDVATARIFEAALEGLDRLAPGDTPTNQEGDNTPSMVTEGNDDTPLYSEDMWCESVKEAVPSAGHRLPPNRHLSELHWVAAANVLKRSLLVIARHDDQSSNLLKEVVVPTRMTLEELKQQEKMAPLIILYKSNHYVPMVLEEDFWNWARTCTVLHNGERLPGLDDASLNALRAYQQESKRDRSLLEGIPQWVESYTMRALADAHVAIQKSLEEETELTPAQKKEILGCFGDPQAMARALPQHFPSVELNRFYVTTSSQAYLDHFRALHIEPAQMLGSRRAYLVVHSREVDFGMCRKLILALRILSKMGLPAVEDGCMSSTPGIINLEEDALGEFFSSLRVCGFDTFTETDRTRLEYKQAVNKGLREIFLGSTVDLNTLRDTRRRPAQWMVSEIRKIKQKYERYLHLNWDRVVEDEAKRVQTIGDLRQAFQSLPRSIVALQYALLHENYPGSSRLTYSQVVLQGFLDRGHRDQTLADIPLETVEDRSRLLRKLLQRYGLPMTGPGFEAAALSVCLPETHDERRTRSAFLNWIEGHRDINVESQGGDVLIEYADDSETVIKKVTLVPFPDDRPLMEMAFLSTTAARSNPPLPPPAPTIKHSLSLHQSSNTAFVAQVVGPRRLSSGDQPRLPVSVLRGSGGGRDGEGGPGSCPPCVYRSRSEGAAQPFFPRIAPSRREFPL